MLIWVKRKLSSRRIKRGACADHEFEIFEVDGVDVPHHFPRFIHYIQKA